MIYLIVYLVISIVVSTYSTIEGTKAAESRNVLFSDNVHIRNTAWLLVCLIWFIGIFVWVPFTIFELIVKPLIKSRVKNKEAHLYDKTS